MLIFTVASVVCAIAAFQFLGFPVRIVYERDNKETQVEGGTILYAFISVFYGLGVCRVLVDCILEVFRPFSQNLDDRSRKKLFFEN